MSAWTSLRKALFKDDLIIRAALFVFGCAALAFGLIAIDWTLGSPQESWSALLVVGIIGIAFLLWGLIVSIAAFTPPSSRWSRFAEKLYPDPGGLDDAAIFFIVILLPAVILTLVLRACGVRGYDDL